MAFLNEQEKSLFGLLGPDVDFRRQLLSDGIPLSLPLQIIILVCILGIIIAIYGFVTHRYRTRIYGRKFIRAFVRTLENEGNFEESLCGCCKDGPSCCHALFCTPCRIVDTTITGGEIRKCFTGWVCLIAACFPCFICCVAPCNRRKIRYKLGGYGGKSCFFGDWFVYVFCTFCVITQEARSVDFAAQTKTGCCCTLIDTRCNSVGEPIEVNHPNARALPPWAFGESQKPHSPKTGDNYKRLSRQHSRSKVAQE